MDDPYRVDVSRGQWNVRSRSRPVAYQFVSRSGMLGEEAQHLRRRIGSQRIGVRAPSGCRRTRHGPSRARASVRHRSGLRRRGGSCGCSHARRALRRAPRACRRSLAVRWARPLKARRCESATWVHALPRGLPKYLRGGSAVREFLGRHVVARQARHAASHKDARTIRSQRPCNRAAASRRLRSRERACMLGTKKCPFGKGRQTLLTVSNRWMAGPSFNLMDRFSPQKFGTTLCSAQIMRASSVVINGFLLTCRRTEAPELSLRISGEAP